jgi:hypothetical protein
VSIFLPLGRGLINSGLHLFYGIQVDTDGSYADFTFDGQAIWEDADNALILDDTFAFVSWEIATYAADETALLSFTSWSESTDYSGAASWGEEEDGYYILESGGYAYYDFGAAGNETDIYSEYIRLTQPTEYESVPVNAVINNIRVEVQCATDLGWDDPVTLEDMSITGGSTLASIEVPAYALPLNNEIVQVFEGDLDYWGLTEEEALAFAKGEGGSQLQFRFKRGLDFDGAVYIEETAVNVQISWDAGSEEVPAEPANESVPIQPYWWLGPVLPETAVIKEIEVVFKTHATEVETPASYNVTLYSDIGIYGDSKSVGPITATAAEYTLSGDLDYWALTNEEAMTLFDDSGTGWVNLVALLEDLNDLTPGTPTEVRLAWVAMRVKYTTS